jgi:hypothetical protein
MNIQCPQCGKGQKAPAQFCSGCGGQFVVQPVRAKVNQKVVAAICGVLLLVFLIFLDKKSNLQRNNSSSQPVSTVSPEPKAESPKSDIQPLDNDVNKSNKTSTQTNVSNSTLTSATTPSPSPQASLSELPKTLTPSALSEMVKNLAIIEGVENNSQKVTRISSLLTELDAKYPENSEQIGDMTAGAYGEITKKGQSASIISIMEAMIEVAESKSKITYADAVTAYAMLRVHGMK